MAERELNLFSIVDCVFRFIHVTCVKEELLNIQLTRMNYIPKHSQDHVDSEYISRMG